MTDDTIYVILRHSGQGQDQLTWAIRWAQSEDEAKALVERAEKQGKGLLPARDFVDPDGPDSDAVYSYETVTRYKPG